MSAYLLDTQCLILFRMDAPTLGRKAARILGNADSQLHLSVASIWEICIKRSLGKLELEMATDEFVETAVSAGVRLLEARPQHLYRVEKLPWHHRDPFDRLLVAQALTEDLTVLTGDPRFEPYGVSVMW